MTRKDYELIAAAFQRAYDAASALGERAGVDLARFSIEAALKSTNPRFSVETFRQACAPTKVKP